MTERQKIRSHARQLRQQVSVQERKVCAKKLCAFVAQHELFHNSQHFACYMASSEELCVQFIIEALLKADKCCYLPVLSEESPFLFFQPYHSMVRLAPNRFGILEPDESVHPFDSKQLDVVFVPAVAFDRQGNRLGMGKGYYDRCFAFKKDLSLPKPILCGIGYDFQWHDSIAAFEWDVPLDYVATNQGVVKVG